MSSSRPLRPRSICIVTCYRQPDYVRAVALRNAAKDSGLFNDIFIVKNAHTSPLRYWDVLIQLLRVRLKYNPDAYLVTFRGYEILPLVLLLGARKTCIYDELVNPVEWFVYEHHVFQPSSLPARMLRALFRAMMRRTHLVLADTPSHALYSAHLMDLPQTLFRALPVGADEATFHPLPPSSRHKKQPFTVLYYGSMLPLHGLSLILDVARQLSDREDIQFHLIGGKKAVQDSVNQAIADGARIIYETWVPYASLPDRIADSSLCLGGPFGDTLQAQFVVTGKTYQFLACSKPTILGQNEESSQGFTDRKNCLIVPRGDSAALTNAITWAVAHPQACNRIGTAGRKLYETHFSAPHLAAQFRHILCDPQLFRQPPTRR